MSLFVAVWFALVGVWPFAHPSHDGSTIGALVEALADEHSTLRRTGRKIAVTPVPPAVESRCAPSRGWFRRLGAIDPQLIPAVLLAVGWLVIAVEVAR